MASSTFIQIDGWFGSGKGVLWSLLNDHPQVFNSPVHDYAHCAFISESNEHYWVTTRHVEILRKALARTQYYMFEKKYRDGFLTFELSTDVALKLKFDYDFYAFDKLFIDRLLSYNVWTIENIVNTLYESMWMTCIGDKQTTPPSFYATAGNPLFLEHYPRMPELIPNLKSIRVRRDVMNIVATRVNRKPRKEDFKTQQFFSDSFEKRMSSNEVENIMNYYAVYDDLQRVYPDKFFTVEFNDLVFNTENTMRKVAEFLDIEFYPIMAIPTFNNKELRKGDVTYIGQENDNVDELLTEYEQSVVNERMRNFSHADYTQ